MTSRLNFFGFAVLVGFASTLAPNAEAKTKTLRCDVVIADASLAGIYAAQQSAAQGAKTCLFTATDWLGGQLTAEAISAIDGPWPLNGIPGARDRAVQCMKPLLKLIPDRADCWVSLDCFSPRSAERALRDWIAPLVSSGKLVLIPESVPLAVTKNRKGDIRSAEFLQRKATGLGPAPYALPLSTEIADWYEPVDSPRYEKTLWKVDGKVFIDATETGELLVLARAEHTLGATDDGCRPQEPESVMSFVSPLELRVRNDADDGEFERMFTRLCPELADGEAFSQYANQWFHVQWENYKFWAEIGDPADEGIKAGKPNGRPSLLGYRRIVNSPETTLMNFGQTLPMAQRLKDHRGGNDYMGGNFIEPATDRSQGPWRGGVRVEELRKAECHAYAFAKWLNQQSEVTNPALAKGRHLTPYFGGRPGSQFGTGHGLAKYPYVRDTRHVRGYGGFCMKPSEYTTDFGKLKSEVGNDPEKLLQLAKGPAYLSRSNTSIGIAMYRLDVRKYPNGVLPQPKPEDLKMTELPLEAHVSANVANLAVAGKLLAANPLVGSALRTQPFECNSGKGVGAAAAVATRRGKTLHEVIQSPKLIQEMQGQLEKTEATLHWFEEAPPEPNHRNIDTMH